MRTIIALVAVLAVVGGAAANDAALCSKLQARTDLFEAAFAKQDPTAAAAFFTSYGVFLSDGYAPFVGPADVAAALEGLMEQGTLGLDVDLTDCTLISGTPVMAYAVGTYVKHGEAGVLDTGHTSFVWGLVPLSDGPTFQAVIASSVSNVTSDAPAPAASAADLMARVSPLPVVPHDSSAARQAAQNFYNKFQEVFNAGGDATSFGMMITDDISIFTKHEPEVSGRAEALMFLTKGLRAKGYSLVSVVVVEAGPRAVPPYVYARGVMTFYDGNGAPVSSNNFLSLLDSSVVDAYQLASFSVTPNNKD